MSSFINVYIFTATKAVVIDLVHRYVMTRIYCVSFQSCVMDGSPFYCSCLEQFISIIIHLLPANDKNVGICNHPIITINSDYYLPVLCTHFYIYYRVFGIVTTKSLTVFLKNRHCQYNTKV